ncbi:helix-turn-helix domain-containing protein [Nocardia sp. GCM10030253]|uniref:TetR/AcrR family transcriptional regulator n=1 Tax=Nocardia sp. GCM10030253 TaxID=3273404 RepID=UPI00363E653E
MSRAAPLGYDQTSVADIAEAADVSKRTFFLHFPTKEDVLLADGSTRIDLAVQAIEGRRPDAPMSEVLAEATKNMIANTAAGDLPNGLAALRARLVVTTPAVQARVLHTMFTATRFRCRATIGQRLVASCRNDASRLRNSSPTRRRPLGAVG